MTSHQDSTFLHTEPRQTCLGLWLALHPATLENGCLWVRPGSHKERLRRRFARTQHESADEAEEMAFETVNPVEEAPFEGGLPEGASEPPFDALFDAGFVPVECEAGDLRGPGPAQLSILDAKFKD